MTITAKELTAIEEQLTGEKRMAVKCQSYAAFCEDPELKKQCEQLAGKHQKHYDSLLHFLN